jgi:hypothetical protein
VRLSDSSCVDVSEDMALKSLACAGVAALALAGMLVACDDPPGPTPTPTPSPPPTTPSPGALTKLEVVGPASVAPGETAQFTATASYADGSTSNVTTRSAWRAQPWCCPEPSSAVLSISSAGVATGHDLGEATVFVSFGGRTSGKTVFVLPRGTFKLSGAVLDDRTIVPGAQVSIVSGPAAGLQTTTDSYGYRFYGVSGDVEVRVTKPGYLEQTKRVTVTSNFSLPFALELAAPRENIGGSYTLTVAAAPECDSKLPEEIRERKYEAVLVQSGPQVTVTLQGTTFYTAGNNRYNTFSGVFEPERLRFELYEGYLYYGFTSFPSVFEQLTTSTYFSMSGSAVLTGSGSRRSGTLDGAFAIMFGPPTLGVTAYCKSSGHRFELAR